jgi:hypothetical protein
MKHLLVLCMALALSAGAAHAAAKAEPKERTAKSIECSKQADTKGLHSTERQKFRAKCKQEK